MSLETTGRVAVEPWWRHAAIYQVYPRSFSDGTGDGIGDLVGLRAHLDYLKDLGVDAIWVTAWFRSPWADGGYDVEDYRDINPEFGELADAEELVAAARSMGLRIIIDLIPNHVSDQHPWFRRAVESGPGSPERDRFWFRDDDGTGLPTNWRSSFGGTTWSHVADHSAEPQWYLHLFTPQQPDLNWNHPDVRAEHLDIVRFWMERGVAGIRIDSAALPVKDPDLPDIVEGRDYLPGTHPHLDRDELHDIYRSWRAITDAFSADQDERILVGEVWLADTERFAAYLRPDEMHMAFNFDLMARPWNAAELRTSIDDTLASHATVGAPATWVLSNHDVTRPVTRLGRSDTTFNFATKRFGTPTDQVLGTRRARAAALLVGALPGVLYIYQGDELGLPEVELPPQLITDPMHFRSGGVDPGRDGCRVPIPWSHDGASLGFSADPAAEPWLPMPAEWADLCVAAQIESADSMLWLYRRLLRLRRDLGTASDIEWHTSPPDVLDFTSGGLRCVVNLGAFVAPLPAGEVLLTSDPAPGTSGFLAPDTAVWLRA